MFVKVLLIVVVVEIFRVEEEEGVFCKGIEEIVEWIVCRSMIFFVVCWNFFLFRR